MNNGRSTPWALGSRKRNEVPAVTQEGNNMLFFGRKKRLVDYASCAG